MPSKVNVLVFPCGSENAAEIHQALRYSLHVELLGASSVEDHGRFRFARYAGGMPRIEEAGFDYAFARLVAEVGIDLVFATHDTVQEYLSTRADLMRFKLVNGDPNTAAVVRRKSRTYALFDDCEWVPRRYEAIGGVTDWPFVVKPDRGQGGQGLQLVHDLQHAQLAASSIGEPLYVEFLPGEELTVDCFSDRHRSLIWIGPRTRERVRAGISMRSTLVPLTPDVETIARTINDRLVFRGPWFFQIKQDASRNWKLLEVSARVAGAMVAQRARGVNLPLMTIHDHLNRPVVAMPTEAVNLVERSIATVAHLDYQYNSVCVDLDDTLIVEGHANAMLMAFLYQCIRHGKHLKLVTRHAHDVVKTLNAARIDPALFDEIAHLPANARKSDHVGDSCIFIDNHFLERQDVAVNRRVPVFDVDAVEFLLR